MRGEHGGERGAGGWRRRRRARARAPRRRTPGSAPPGFQAVARARLAEGDVELAERLFGCTSSPGTQTPAPTPSECVRAHARPWPSTATMFVVCSEPEAAVSSAETRWRTRPLAQAGEAGHAREELGDSGQATPGRDPVAVELHPGRVRHRAS